MQAKSKVAAGLFGILLGGFGVHNFYLGYTGKAVGQLLLWIFGFLALALGIGMFLMWAAGIWGLIEGIIILSSQEYCDANGVPLA